MSGLSRLLALLLRAVRVCGRVGLFRSAAALAYYLVLSLFPVLLFVHELVAHFRLDLVRPLEALRPLLPEGVFSLLSGYLADAAGRSAPGLFWAGLFTIALSASAGLRTVFRTLDDLFSLPHRHGALHLFSSVLLALLFLLTVSLSLLVVLTGQWFFLLLDAHLPAAWLPLSGLWRWLRYVLLFGCVLLLVGMVYRLGVPRAQAGDRAVLLAALTASLALAGCSGLFSRLLSLSTRYDLVYGSLASLAILLVWLYLCGAVLLLGAAFLSLFSSHP